MQRKTIQRITKGAAGFLAALIVFAVFPISAFAGPSPTPAEPWCYSYGGTPPTNACFPTQAGCIADSNGKIVTSACGLAGKPDVTTMTPAEIEACGITCALARQQADKEASGWSLSRAWNSFIGGIKDLATGAVGLLLKGLAFIIFSVAGYFLQSMAFIMDLSIKTSIDSGIMGGLAFVNTGWTIVRDISNMFFIFALLYIAIQTILGMAGSSTKRMVANVIIAALLINFSLFFTKVVIDAGNVLANAFWDKLKVQVRSGATTYDVASASSKALGGLDLQTLWSDKTSKQGKAFDGLSYMDQAKMYAGGAVFMFIAGYIFLAAAILMVTRTIKLMLAMVFSPFAFLCFAVPGMRKHWDSWLDNLIKQTFIAPVFLFMMYLNAILIDSVDLTKLTGGESSDATFSAAVSGDPRGYAIILNFVLMIGFLLASLGIANAFAGGAAAGALSISKKVTGFVAGGSVAATAYVGGAALRQTVGRAGQRTAESKKLQSMAENGNWVQRKYANTMIRSGMALKDANFDMRNSKTAQMLAGKANVNLGVGSNVLSTQKSYGKSGAAYGTRWAGGTVGVEAIDKYTKEAQRLYPNSPAAQEKYLRDKLGRFYDGGKDLPKATEINMRDEDGNLRLGLIKQGVSDAAAQLKTGLREGRVGQFGVGGGVALSGDAAKKAKEARERIENAQKTDQAKKTIKDATSADETKKFVEMQDRIDTLKNQEKLTEEETKELANLSSTMKDSADKIAAAFGKLTGKETADLIDSDKLKDPRVLRALQGKDVAGVAAKGTDLDKEYIEAFTQGVAKYGSESAKRALRNQATVGGPLAYNAEEELKRVMADYGDGSDPTKKAAAAKQVGIALGMMGGTTEIAKLDGDILSHEAVATKLNSETIKKIKKRIEDHELDDSVGEAIAKHNPEKWNKSSGNKNKENSGGRNSGNQGSRVITPTAEQLDTSSMRLEGDTTPPEPTPAPTSRGPNAQTSNTQSSAQRPPVNTGATNASATQNTQQASRASQTATRVVNKEAEVRAMKMSFPPDAQIYHDGQTGYVLRQNGAVTEGSKVTFQQDGSIGAVQRLTPAEISALQQQTPQVGAQKKTQLTPPSAPRTPAGPQNKAASAVPYVNPIAAANAKAEAERKQATASAEAAAYERRQKQIEAQAKATSDRIAAQTQVAAARQARLEAVKQSKAYLAYDQEVRSLQAQAAQAAQEYKADLAGKGMSVEEGNLTNSGVGYINQNRDFLESFNRKIADVRKLQSQLIENERLQIAHEESLQRSGDKQ